MPRLEINKLHWWYWAASWGLIVAGMCGETRAFGLVTALAAVQVVHYAARDRSLTTLAVQVRLSAFALFALGLWLPALFWIPAIGLLARCTVNYCVTARLLKLLPWNRGDEALSAALVQRVLLSRPSYGAFSAAA